MNICIIDGKLIKDREMLHRILAELPGVPDWYGRNLDALHDCLTDIQEELLRPDLASGELCGRISACTG